MKSSRYLLYLTPMVLFIGALYYSEQTTHLLWFNKQWANESFHSTIEAMGASAAIFVGVFLLQKTRIEGNGKLFFVAIGFLSMGLLDGFHAISLPGQGFVFLHSIAALAGSIGLALVWFPNLGDRAFRKRWIPWAVGTVSIVGGIWALSFPETLPQMVHNGAFTRFSLEINRLSGMLFLIATLHFLLDFRQSEETRNYLLASLALLFGISGLFFANSALWDYSWWQWHFLRLLAYFLALGFLFREFHFVQQELKESNKQLKLDLAKRISGKKALKESEERFKALSDAAHGGVAIHSRGTILECNTGLSDITGFSYEELTDSDGLRLIAPDSLDTVLANIKRGYEKVYEVEGVRKDGSIYPLAIKGKSITYKGHEARVTEFLDITERKKAENDQARLQMELQRAQKMDAIGQLTGGIAHDFNNILGIVIGNLELLTPSVAGDEKAMKRITSAGKAAQRAADLTKQLLSFSRKQEDNTKTTPINQAGQ